MKRAKLEDMSPEELVDRFLAIAIEQDHAILYDDNARYNRLFDQMEAVEAELRSRAGDQRALLLPLHEHENLQVRLKSAIATLAILPEASRAVLQWLSDRKRQPQAGDARGMMRALDTGRYVPT